MYGSYVIVFSRITKTLGIAFMVLAILTAKAPTASAAEKYSIDPVSGTKYKPDGDMRELLITLSALGGKPIETLTPAQARAQPTMTDAVNTLLNKRGHHWASAQPGARCPRRHGNPCPMSPRWIPYHPGPSRREPELHAILYTPTGPGPFPAIVFFCTVVGGSSGAPESYATAAARGLAESGVQARSYLGQLPAGTREQIPSRLR